MYQILSNILQPRLEYMKKMGDYKHALTFFRAYTIMQERYQNKLISQDLLFADKRHQLEKAHLIQIQNRDRIISAIICGSFVLLIIVGWIYYKLRLSRSEREITKKKKLKICNLRKKISIKKKRESSWKGIRELLKPTILSLSRII